MASQTVKNIGNFLFRFGLSAALLWYIFSKIDMEKTTDVLKSADLAFLGYAFGIFFIINLILLWRWLIFIRALNLEVSFFDAFRFFFIGLFGNLFLPSAIGGDIIKIVGLCKGSEQKPRVVASVLLDRLSGFASISLVATCSFIFGYSLVGDVTILTAIVLMAGGSITLAAILFNERIYEFGCRVFNKFPKVKNSLMTMHYDIALLKDKKREGLKAIAVSCLCQVIFAFSYFLVAKGLHQDINYVYFLIFVPIICVASSFPSIGGLGVREAGAAFLFSKVGVDSGIAVSLSLINFLFMVLIGLLGGVIYVATLFSGRIQRPTPNAAASSR